MFIFNTLAPIFVLIAVGALSFHFGFLNHATLHGINRLACWVALPALLFHGAATADYSSGGVGPTVFVLIASSLVGIVVAIMAAFRAMNLDGVAAGTFVHVATRANLSFVGLPVLLYIAEARSGPAAASLRSLTLLAMAPYLLMQNVAGILALLLGRHQPGAAMLRVVVKDVATHPLLIAIGAGMLVGLSGLDLPLFLDRSISSVGATAAPVALIAIGASLMTISVRENVAAAALATTIKVLLMPAVGWALGHSLGLGRDQLLVVLVFLACPTGAASFSLVAEMGGDQSVASASIMMSTIAAVVPLTIVMLGTA